MSAVIGYARVSTDDQDLEGQRLRLSQAGASRVFTDKLSGRIDERPGLSALLDYARPGDTVAVVRLDRLGRSLPRLLELVEGFKRRGLGFTSLEERIDTTTAGGELIFHVFGALAQFERRLIGDRTRDGLAAARARGRRIGRPARDPEKIGAALVLVAGGLSVARAAATVGIGRATLYEEVRRQGSARIGDRLQP